MTGSGVAVIIVNYGTADLAIAAVESVLTRTHGRRGVEVHLIDNASPGGDAARFEAARASEGWGDRVTLYAELENHGFGRGNNVALEALAARDTPPDYVFLLNPDARLENEAIATLTEALDAHPEAAAAGARVAGPDGTLQAAAFRFPRLTRDVLATLNFGPLVRRLPGQKIALPPDTPEGPVDWVTGAAVMLRFKALRDVGFFDPGFFLYYEEVELMHRLRRAGWSVIHVPDARVIHAEGAATGQGVNAARAVRRPSYVYQSWRHYFVTCHGRAYALATAFLKVPAAAANLTIARLRGKSPSVPEGFFADHWRYALRPLLSGKPS